MKHPIFTFLIFAIMNAHAQESNFNFSHSVSTIASPEAIWKVWTDVANWKTWDKGLKEATLKDTFRLGAKGKLIPDKGPASKFIISAIEPGTSYTFQTRIPFGWLIIQRRLEYKNGLTHFTHHVRFTGLFKKVLGKKIGARYRAMLPEVMEEIKRMASPAGAQSIITPGATGGRNTGVIVNPNGVDIYT